MIKLEQLEQNVDLDFLLEPKRKIYDLVLEINGSMLTFHKTVKSSKDIEALANDVFKIKNDIKRIRSNSSMNDMNSLTNKLIKIKPMKATEIDFI